MMLQEGGKSVRDEEETMKSGGGEAHLQEIPTDLRSHNNTQQEITAGLRSASENKQSMLQEETKFSGQRPSVTTDTTHIKLYLLHET